MRRVLLCILAAIFAGAARGGRARADGPADGPDRIFQDPFLENLVGEWKIVRRLVGRTAENLPTTGFYLSLHVGDVFYGNIGSADRLDFTVIGPAVNEVTRINGMCRALDQDVVLSSAFAEAAGPARSRLVGLGRYALRGVARSQELFTLEREG